MKTLKYYIFTFTIALLIGGLIKYQRTMAVNQDLDRVEQCLINKEVGK